MESQGQRRGSSPTVMLASLMGRREKLQEDLRNIEKQVYEMETGYLQDSTHIGTALRGFEGFLSSSKSNANLKRSRKFQAEDRLFSLSSVTSPAAEELGAGLDEGRPDFGSVRSKAGGLPNGQGKPKKGRISTGGREIKKTRASSEAELDDEDDSEMQLK